MSRYTTIYTDVEVCLDEFDSDDLIAELEARGYATEAGESVQEQLEAIYRKRVLGQDYTQELDALIYHGIGRII